MTAVAETAAALEAARDAYRNLVLVTGNEWVTAAANVNAASAVHDKAVAEAA